MNKQERINKINNLLDRYYGTEDSFEQTDLAIKLIQGHVDWLIEQAKKVSELKKENEWLDGREKIDKQNAVLSIQLRDLQQKNARLQQALEFYADKKNYDDIGIPTPNGEIVTPIMEDGGEIARQKLEGTE